MKNGHDARYGIPPLFPMGKRGDFTKAIHRTSDELTQPKGPGDGMRGSDSAPIPSAVPVSSRYNHQRHNSARREPGHFTAAIQRTSDELTQPKGPRGGVRGGDSAPFPSPVPRPRLLLQAVQDVRARKRIPCDMGVFASLIIRSLGSTLRNKLAKNLRSETKHPGEAIGYPAALTCFPELQK